MSDTGFKAPTYEEWYNQQQNKINQDTQAAKDLANITYHKSKSEYGSKAAALESMGLTGSGYSDYLNSQAYAQMQSAYANADAQRAQSMFDLDTKYMEYLDQQEREEKQRQDTINSNFVTAMGSITADTTNTEIEQMAALGFSPEQITSLKTQRDALVTKRTEDEAKAAEDKQQSAYQTILGMINHETSDAMIDALAAAYGLTDATKIANAKSYQNTYLTDYLKSLDPTELTVDDLNRYYPDKTGDTYTTLLNKIITSAQDSVYSGMFKGDDKATEGATFTEIKNLINSQIEATPDETQKASLQTTLETLESEYNKAYPAEIDDSKTVKFKTGIKLDKDWVGTTGKAGNDITIGNGRKNYQVQYSGEESADAATAAKNKGLSNDDVFVYNDHVYVYKKDGDTYKAYELKRRGWPYMDDFDNLLKAITG